MTTLLQIFKPGRHPASDGRTIAFSAEQLAASARAYDPAKHEAPLVIGHPAADAPAYGWVESLSFGETLDAKPRKVEEQFAQLVRDERFKKISASFYEPDSPNNPVPGVYYLRHVGFLGAQAPAVKGLKSASFAADERGVIEFTDWNGMTIASLFRKIKNWIIDQSGQEKADAILPEYDIENLQVNAAQKEPAPSPAYSETEGDDVDKQEIEREKAQLKTDQDKLARERAEFAERDKALKASETAAQIAQRRRGAAEFVELQVKEGRVLPAHREGLVAFMAALPEAGVVEFGEGDKAVKKPSAEWLREYLKAQPKIIDFAERAAGAGGELQQELTAEQLAARALEFQESERKAGREISVTAAVTRIQQQAAR